MIAVLTICLPSPLSAQKRPPGSGQKGAGAHVPFVGCASDGQVGPVEAPKRAEVGVQINAKAAQRLAYYQSESSLGVLAPRGWFCFGTYGSNASNLFVTPQPIKRDDLFSTTWGEFTGPAIQASKIYGGTSGRFEVARVMARVFPAQKAFVEQVIKEGLEPASDFPSGPYPQDKLISQSDRIVEFETPPHAEGLGSKTSLLRANCDPISGVVILQGEAPDLLFLGVRLPSGTHDLTPYIIQQIELDNAASPSEK